MENAVYFQKYLRKNILSALFSSPSFFKWGKIYYQKCKYYEKRVISCFYVLLFFILSFSCKKENTSAGFFSFNGQVVDGNTQLPVKGIYIRNELFHEGDGTWFSPSIPKGLINVVTDNNGEFYVSFKDLDIKETYFCNIALNITSGNYYNSLDTTLIGWNYTWYPGHSFFQDDLKDKLIIHLSPSGIIRFLFNRDDWDVINADTIFIKSVQDTYIIKYSGSGKYDLAGFNFMPDSSYIFSYYAIKNGTDSLLRADTIFVPNCNRIGNWYEYLLMF